MMKVALAAQTPVHGGDLAATARRYGLDPAALVDFSANINPLGVPHGVRTVLARGQSRNVESYPERDGTPLLQEIVERLHVPADHVVIANGSAALIDAAIRAISPARALVPVPAFSEYGRALDALGCERRSLQLDPDRGFVLDAVALAGAIERWAPQLVILTNPHNPSGALVTRDAMQRVLEQAGHAGTWVLLDEAFIDYAPDDSVCSCIASMQHVVVLRSLTKFYAMPAIRVGFALAAQTLAGRMRTLLPSWPVSTIALEAGAAALSDPAYDRRTVASNVERRDQLCHALQELGLHVVPAAANFVMTELPKGLTSASAAHWLLTEFGCYVRECSDYQGLDERSFLRIAVKDESSNARLLAALAQLVSSTSRFE